MISAGPCCRTLQISSNNTHLSEVIVTALPLKYPCLNTVTRQTANCICLRRDVELSPIHGPANFCSPDFIIFDATGTGGGSGGESPGGGVGAADDARGIALACSFMSADFGGFAAMAAAFDFAVLRVRCRMLWEPLMAVTTFIINTHGDTTGGGCRTMCLEEFMSNDDKSRIQ